MGVVHFYRASDSYGWLSNFSRHAVHLDDRIWSTTEHYFQAQKFHDEALRERVRTAPSPGEAKKAGRSAPARSDWDDVRDEVMLRALRAKFTQHPDLRAALVATADAELVEHTRKDRYWGDGGGGGRNRLGELLMKVRDELA